MSSCNQSLLTYLTNTPGIIPQPEVDETTLVVEQNAIASKWVINHNLGKIPHVTALDAAGNIFKPHVKHLNTNIIVITTNPPASGTVYLN